MPKSRRAWTYRNLTREDFDRAVDFVATGGYALRAYERYAKLKPAGRRPTCASPIRASPSNTGSISAPSSKPRC